MIVQNIAGGGQAIGLTQVAQQKGNTHMLAVANPASVAGLLVAGKGAPNIKELPTIAQLALDEQLIIVKSDSRFKSIKDIAVCSLQQRWREHGSSPGRPCGHDVGEPSRIHRPV